jgi:hypothetical protein
MGDVANKLQPILETLGAVGFAGLIDQMQRAGQIMGADVVKAADRMDEALSRLQKRLKNEVGGTLVEFVAGLGLVSGALQVSDVFGDTDRPVQVTAEEMIERKRLAAAAAALQAEQDADAQRKAIADERQANELKAADKRDEANRKQDAANLRRMDAESRALELAKQLVAVREELANMPGDTFAEQMNRQADNILRRIELEDQLAAAIRERDSESEKAGAGDVERSTEQSYGSGASLESIGGFSGGRGNGVAQMVQRQTSLLEAISRSSRTTADVLTRTPPLTVGGE